MAEEATETMDTGNVDSMIQEDGPITDEGDGAQEEVRTSVFGETVPSDEELLGDDDDDPDGEKAASGEKDTDNPDPKDDDAKDPDKKDTEDGKGEPEPDKPPKGYVPLNALHESRAKERELRAEIEELKAQVAVKKPDTDLKGEPEEEFQELTDEEYDELVEADPQEALRYSRKAERHKERQAEVANQQKREVEMCGRVADRMIEIEPDLFNPASDVGKKLTEFAAKNGLPGNYVEVLTDPRTKLTTAGGKTIPLSDTASGMVELIVNSYRMNSASDPEGLRARITAEVTEKLTKQITKDIMSKFKSGESNFTSITDAPGGSDEPTGKAIVLTEAQLRKLSSKQREEYLDTGTYS